MPADTKRFPYLVSIPYKKGDTITSWNLVCSDCVDTYGLPGDKYQTEVSSEYMNFYFRNEQDAIWFSLSAL